MIGAPQPPTISTANNEQIRHLSFSIGFDLNSLLHQLGLVESACRAHMRSEGPMAIVGL